MPSQGKRLDALEMTMMRLTLPCIVFFLVFICAKNVANAADSHWCYKDEACNARMWEGECQFGKQQSPIDFNSKNTKVHDNTARLRFNKKYMDVQRSFLVKNNGHTIQVQLTDDLSSDLVFDGDLLRGSYRFSQLHFHWGSHADSGSEHTVNNQGYVAELHLVHYSNEYKSLTEAVASKDRRGLSVLGIFFELSSDENFAMKPIVDAISEVDTASSKVTTVNSPLNISALFPEDLSLWRYYGSLTTPSCNEVVHWNVFKKPVRISRDQWHKFLSSRDSQGKVLEDNFRPTQPTINRKVYLLNKVSRATIPDAGETDRNPPADDTFYSDAQKAINSKQGSDDKNKQNNGAKSPHGGVLNSAITGFVLLSVFLQVMFASVLRCI